jgi:hypothetical protein
MNAPGALCICLKEYKIIYAQQNCMFAQSYDTLRRQYRILPNNVQGILQIICRQII